MNERFRNMSLNKKIPLSLLLILIIVSFVSFAYLISRQKNIDFLKKKKNLAQLSLVVDQSISNLMILGEMDLVEDNLQDVASEESILAIHLLDKENKVFSSTDSSMKGMEIHNSYLKNMSASKIPVTDDTRFNEGQITYFQPVLLTEDCLQCHDGKTGDLIGILATTQSTQDVLTNASNNRRVLIGIAAIFVIIIGLFSVFTLRVLVVTPVNHALNSMKEIAQGSSTFTNRLEVSSRDEIGKLAYYFNMFMEKLQQEAKVKEKVQEDVRTEIDSLNHMTEQLTAISANLKDKAVEINSQSGRVNKASNDMNDNMTSVTTIVNTSRENISAVDGATANMVQAVSEIAENAEKARGVTLSAVSSMSAAENSVNSLGKAAEEVQIVVNSILEIADQTKLLALNATIEAARAGEAGKGFAVVASEVKDLAVQTNTLTENIISKINTISEMTGVTVKEIKSTASIMADVSDMVNTIAAAVEEQNISTQQIAQNIAEAMDGMNQVVSGVEDAAYKARDVGSSISEVDTNIADIRENSEKLDGNIRTIRDSGEKLGHISQAFD